MKNIELTQSLVSYDVHASFWGKNFKPSDLSKNSTLKLSGNIDRGEISRTGRYKGELSAYGTASLVLPENIKDDHFEKQLDWILSVLETNKKSILKSNIENFTIYISIGYSDQCNLVLDSLVLKRIADLNADLSFDVYKYEDVGMKYMETANSEQLAVLKSFVGNGNTALSAKDLMDLVPQTKKSYTKRKKKLHSDQ